MFSSLLQTVVAIALAPLGRRRLDELLADGAPEYLRPPIRFLLGEPLAKPDCQAVERVESIRSTFLQKEQMRRLLDASLESDGKQLHIDLDNIESKRLLSGWTARISSVPQYWGTFLYLLASGRRAKSIIELGSCIGISGSYLASADCCTSFITVEQSRVLATLANFNLRRVARKVRVLNTFFDDALDKVLPELDVPLDMVYFDGQHEKTPTLHYLDRLIPYVTNGSLLVFDDIHWSRDMVEAWQIIAQRPGLSFTLDLGRLGVAVWNEQNPRPKNYDLSLYTRWWQSGIATFRDKS